MYFSEDYRPDRRRHPHNLPNVLQAGKVKPVGDRTENCLQDVLGPHTPPEVRKFKANLEPGVPTKHPGKANDPDVASSLIHGIRTKRCDNSYVILNPPPRTLFQETLQDLSESCYASRRKAPLGRSHDQKTGLPSWYNSDVTFGIKSARDLNVGDIIKSSELLARESGGGESQPGKNSFNDLGTEDSGAASEQTDDKQQVSGDSRFRVVTTHVNDGQDIRKTLRWHDQSLRFYNTKPTWTRSKESRNKMMRLYGVKETKNIPSILAEQSVSARGRSDEYGVGDLLTSTDSYRKKDKQLAQVFDLQHRLKKINYHKFPSLLQAFRHYDKESNGEITRENLQEVCREFQLDASISVLEELFSHCDIDNDGVINFLEFANFLNWKDKVPLNKREQSIITNERQTSSALDNEAPASKALIQPEDLEPVASGSSLKTVRTLRRLQTDPEHFATSSSIFGRCNGQSSPQSDSRTFGIPTLRSDLPAPRVKRVSDSTNYGDTSTAADLLHPSVHSVQGVYEQHFFSPLTKKEMMEIFRNVGVSISDEMFEEAWKMAAMRDRAGNVCVEVFRTVLKEMGAM